MVHKRFCTKIDTPVKLQVVKSRLIESNVMRESNRLVVLLSAPQPSIQPSSKLLLLVALFLVSCGWSTTAAGVTREPPLPIPSSMAENWAAPHRFLTPSHCSTASCEHTHRRIIFAFSHSPLADSGTTNNRRASSLYLPPPFSTRCRLHHLTT
ncbi:conserved domain protein [Trichinella spiralis]|uniref:hypothetical protein n=1 Tax=Trichinella spiralis TaxID=6334 RepID=UPI0001EFB22E|nr:conserved domain protein [Trichinella spiralis]